jgi:hypothetical protein
MTLVGIILTLAIVGFLVWLVTQISMPQVIRNIIVAVVVIFLVVFVLQRLGINTSPVPKLELW